MRPVPSSADRDRRRRRAARRGGDGPRVGGLARHGTRSRAGLAPRRGVVVINMQRLAGLRQPQAHSAPAAVFSEEPLVFALRDAKSPAKVRLAIARLDVRATAVRLAVLAHALWIGALPIAHPILCRVWVRCISRRGSSSEAPLALPAQSIACAMRPIERIDRFATDPAFLVTSSSSGRYGTIRSDHATWSLPSFLDISSNKVLGVVL